MPLEPHAPLLPNPVAEAADELKRLKDTTDREVQRGATAVAGLTSEEEEGRRRGHRDRRRATWAQVEGWAIKAAAVIGIGLAVCLAIIVICVLVRWLGVIFKTPDKLDSLVRGAVWAILVAVATWGANNLLRRDD